MTSFVGSEFKPKDPIAKTKDCKPDIEKFRKLGINTVRIYSIDNSNPTSHDECMKLLADAGIYVALDVNTANFSLNNFYEEAIHPSYNDQYLQSVFATVEAFAKYDNTLLFFSGNEVVFFANKTFAAPYVKAVTRDIKQYLKTRGLRQVPVGYAGKDIPENRVQMAEYMNCGTGDVRADFHGFNDYSWCSPSSLVNSDWSNKASMFTKYGIPAL